MERTYHLRRHDLLFFVNDKEWNKDVDRATSHTKAEWQLIAKDLKARDYELVETFESLHNRAAEELI